MRGVFFALAAALFVEAAFAFDAESTEFIDYILEFSSPREPSIFGNSVVFTASSAYKRVGVVFANEGFETIHWFTKLLVSIDDTEPFDPKRRRPPETLRDSGILFCVYTPEEELETIEYRLIMDGLWCTDPLNKNKRLDIAAGTELSFTAAPKMPGSFYKKRAGTLSLRHEGPAGETVSVAGDFNGWDPFMYYMKEVVPGRYEINIPLPAGKWHYVFFLRGARVLDRNSAEVVYSKNGMTANYVELE